MALKIIVTVFGAFSSQCQLLDMAITIQKLFLDDQ